MFTDRYICVPIRIYNVKQEELLGKEAIDCELIEIELRVNPFKIENYYPCIPAEAEFGKENITCTRLIMESGEAHLVYLEVQEFEKILNRFGNDK